jgi:hypothetical protein
MQRLDEAWWIVAAMLEPANTKICMGGQAITTLQ